MDAGWLKIVQEHSLHLELYYSKTMDWYLHIYQKAGADYCVEICEEQSPDLGFVMAKGEVALKGWLLKNNGGY